MQSVDNPPYQVSHTAQEQKSHVTEKTLSNIGMWILSLTKKDNEW